MKQIKECLGGMQDITPYLKGETRVDEGLKDIFAFVKDKFKKAVMYVKNIVAKVGAYFVNVTDEGLVLPAISPLTAGSAYVEGYINKNNTFVHMGKEAARITGCKTKLTDATKLYGSGNSIAYWNQLVNENNEEAIATILEYFNNFEGEAVNEVKLHTEDPEAKYNIIVDDTELKNYIKMVITNKKLAKLLIWGAPGIGKTAILMNVLEEMGNENTDFKDYQLICKTLSNETPDNFTLPKYVSEVDDDDFESLAKKLNKEPSTISKLLKKVGMDKATDVPKTWLPVYKPTGDAQLDLVLDEKCGKGLLFVDELSRATPQVLNVILPLVNEGMFNGYKLGSGWTIICASNRMEDEEGGSQSKIGNALANRFLQVHYEPTVHTWRKWADQQGFISPLLLQWLSMPESEEMSGGRFYYMDPNDDSGRLADTTLMCTPRAWTNAMRLLAAFNNTGSLEGFKIFDIPRNIIASTLNSCVPAQAVDSFMAFLSVIEKIGNFDQAVYDIWQNGGKNTKIDKKHLSKVALPLAQLICCAHAKDLPNAKEWENLCDWLVDQKSDQMASYVLDIFQNIFLAEIDPKMRLQLLTYQERVRRTTDPAKLNVFISDFSGFCSRWGISSEQIPDYTPGLSKLVKAYGSSFKSAVIDAHTSALG